MVMTVGGLAQRLVAVPAPLLLAGCAAASSGAGPAPSPPDGRVSAPGEVQRVLHLDMEDVAAPAGTIVPRVDNALERHMAVSVATAADGRVVTTEGSGGVGRALRFPAFSPSGPVAAAVLVVRAGGRRDALAPDRRAFRFGARFTLDERSAGTRADDGDTLVQRGQAADDVQYKLQIDDGVPSCLVRGKDGRVLAKVSTRVERQTWYDVTCSRTDDGVRLRLDRSDGTGKPLRARSRGATGRLRPERAVPLSVGGKVSTDGEVAISSTDQFNGHVDDVFVEYQR